VVDRSGKVLVAPDAVAADVEDLARRDDRAGDRLAGDLLAVYVEAERAAAEGGGEVGPSVERQRRGADGGDVGAAGVDDDGGERGVVGHVEAVRDAAGPLLHGHGAPAV